MSADILMVVYNRAAYTRRTLPRLLEVANAEGGRVWLWRNGDDAAVGDAIAPLLDHPALHRVHHEPANAPLRDAANWLWRESDGDFVGKVDDDCVVHDGWLAGTMEDHRRGTQFGSLCAWHYAEEDFDPDLAAPKIEEIDGVRLLRNMWTAGSGYLMSRACVDDVGPIRSDESWFDFCVRASRRGWVFGWPLPLRFQDHLDDPRAHGSGVTSDAELERSSPLSAHSLGVQSVEEWLDALRADARHVQTSSLRSFDYGPIGKRVNRLRRRLRPGAATRKPIY
ncbi:MAG: glycosyltransferase [Actinomycetota bacterium]